MSSSSSSSGSDTPPDAQPATTTFTREQQLRTAMKLTDVIRRQEALLQPTLDGDNDPLQSLRNFLETPGVKQGCMAATVCVGVLLPTRRFLLRVANQRLNLGTILPDLILTPALTVATAQFSLWAGSVYGSAAYLLRIAEIPVTTPSPTVDAICSDPVTLAAFENPLWFSQGVISNTKNNSWDPREHAVLALQQALCTCRERHSYQEKEAAFASDKTQSTFKSNRTSWWR
jgi:hypothetical protein